MELECRGLKTSVPAKLGDDLPRARIPIERERVDPEQLRLRWLPGDAGGHPRRAAQQLVGELRTRAGSQPGRDGRSGLANLVGKVEAQKTPTRLL